jgi:hypothetical protein
MDNFGFWQRWLFVVGLFVIIFGLLMSFLSQTGPFDLLFNNQINPIFWGGRTAPEEVVSFQGWIYGVLGATVAGWGITLAFIARYPFKNKEKWAWNCVTLGMLVWFIVDTAISLYFGVIFNALFNTFLLIAVMIPVTMSHKAFTDTL